VRHLTRIRISAATRGVLLLVPTVFAYGVDMRPFAEEGYWSSVSGKVSFGLTFVGPACAVCGAWEAGRLRRARVFAWAPARGRLRVTVDALVPVLLLGLAGVIAGLVAAWPAVAGAPGGPNPLIALTWGMVIVGHTAWGFLLGHFLIAPAAIPTAAMTAYVWMAYPATLSNPWVRHLNGVSLESCCALDQEPSTRVVAGVCVLAAGSVLAVSIAVAGPRRAATYAIASAVVAVSGVGGALSVHTMGTEAVQTRDNGGTCSGTAPRVCLWPEQGDGARGIGDRLRTSHAALVAAGIDLPGTLTTTDPPAPDRLRLWLTAHPTGQEAVMALAAAMLPAGPPECARQGRPYAAYAAYAPTLAWLGLTAGAAPGAETDRIQPRDWQLAAHVREFATAQQLAWYTTNRDALATCGVPAALDPTGTP